jgi:WD40 repeat protein
MGIAFDLKSGYIYSCSTDKKFIISDITYQDSLTEVANDKYGFTNMVFDKKNERIFLTNEGGLVSVYSVNTFPPTLLNTVATSSKGSIRGFHVDYKKFYIFSGSVAGKICILELGLPGKERFIKELSAFNSNKKIRVIKYNSINNEVMLGGEDGKVTIWSLRKGVSICNLF